MEGAFGVSVDRNYSSRAWHLELDICVVRHRIELCECGSSEQGVIATAKQGHLECDLFGPIILRRAEYHIYCDFSRTSCLPTRDDSS